MCNPCRGSAASVREAALAEDSREATAGIRMTGVRLRRGLRTACDRPGRLNRAPSRGGGCRRARRSFLREALKWRKCLTMPNRCVPCKPNARGWVSLWTGCLHARATAAPSTCSPTSRPNPDLLYPRWRCRSPGPQVITTEKINQNGETDLAERIEAVLTTAGGTDAPLRSAVAPFMTASVALRVHNRVRMASSSPQCRGKWPVHGAPSRPHGR